MSNTVSIRVVTRAEEIRHEWLTLEKNELCHSFQRYDWVRAWCATFALSFQVEPCIVLVSDNDTPLFILPLCIMRRRSHKTVEFIDGGISDYTGPVLSPQALLYTAREFSALFDRICLELPKHDCVMLRKMTTHIGGAPNPLMRLPHVVVEELKGFARPLAKLQSSTLSTNREAEKKFRKLTSAGRKVTISDRVNYQAFDTLAQWKRAQYPAYLSKHMTEFYRQLLHFGSARLFQLYIDDELAAAQYTVMSGLTYTGLILGFNQKWAKVSPGKILLTRMFQLLFAEGCTVFDLGCGNETYKEDFGPGWKKLSRYTRATMQKGPTCSFALQSHDKKQYAIEYSLS